MVNVDSFKSHHNNISTSQLIKMKYRLLLSPRFLFFYMVLSLAVPNVALCFTENTPFIVDVVGVLMPLAVYALIMSLNRCFSCWFSSLRFRWCSFICTATA